MNDIAKIFIYMGVTLTFFGFVLLIFGKLPGVGRLPGDILIKKENFTFYFPLATSFLVSVILSLIFFLWQRR